jgi:hypothetical protein
LAACTPYGAEYYAAKEQPHQYRLQRA